MAYCRNFSMCVAVAERYFNRLGQLGLVGFASSVALSAALVLEFWLIGERSYWRLHSARGLARASTGWGKIDESVRRLVFLCGANS